MDTTAVITSCGRFDLLEKTITSLLHFSDEEFTKIIEGAIQKKSEVILITEDDCFFTDEIINIDSYFENLPPDWHMLYMGGNHNTIFGVRPPIQINSKVVKLTHTFTSHFVAIKSIVFQEIIEKINQKNKPLDVLYSELQKKYNAYSFYPAIAKQLSDFSDIQNKVVNYDYLIK